MVRVSALGAEGYRFKSCHPDLIKLLYSTIVFYYLRMAFKLEKNPLNIKSWMKQKQKWQNKREQRLAKNKIYWNKFSISMTLKRRNTFINLGHVEYTAKQRMQRGRIKKFNPRGRITKTLTYISAGNCGLKGAKKSAPMANITIGEFAGAKFKKFGINHLRGRYLGSGRRRREIIKGFANVGLLLYGIRQDTKRPHNGVRHKKPRRK